MIRKTLLVALAALYAGGAWAGHANPWATEDDEVLSQNHEENLLQSVDTPGEDEMLGVMVQEAHGKLDDMSGGSDAGEGEGGKH